jgi:Spy/CpxP family protein refolding chaperone
MTETSDVKQPVARGRLRVLGWAAVGLAGALVAGVTTVWASGPRLFMRFAHRGWGHHSGHFDITEAREHVDAAVRFALRGVGASEEQQQRVSAIATTAVDDLRPLHERHRQNREAFHAALVKPTVDRQALEELRKAEVQLADEAATRIVRAMADAAEVLTPEQRAQLASFAERMHH